MCQFDPASSTFSRNCEKSLYSFLIMECSPKPLNEKQQSDITIDVLWTSRAPGAFHRCANFTCRNAWDEFCAHWNAGETCDASPYFLSNARIRSSSSLRTDDTALRTDPM